MIPKSKLIETPPYLSDQDNLNLDVIWDNLPKKGGTDAIEGQLVTSIQTAGDQPERPTQEH